MRHGDEQNGRGAADGSGAGDSALVRRAVDAAGVLAAVANRDAGAQVLFTGTARARSEGVETKSLDYEAHEAMAGPALERLCAETVDRFGLCACAVEHRLGRVDVGETSVAVATSAAHRRDAFAAAAWLMDRIKHDVPIWKCEERVDGTREWIHPGDMTAPPPAPRRRRGGRR